MGILLMKIIKNSFTALLLLSYASIAISMDRNASNGFLKNMLRKGSIGLQWANAAGPCWAFSISQLAAYHHQKNNAKDLALKYPELAAENQKKEAWIRQILKSNDYKDWETVDIQQSSEFSAVTNFNKKMILCDGGDISEAYDEQNSLRNSIKKHFGMEKKELYNEVRGVLSHETTHLEKHHPEKGIILGLTMPILTHQIVNRMLGLNKVPNLLNAKPKIGLKIFSCASQLALNVSTLWTFLNLAEKEADEGVVNDVQVLKGAANHMRKHAAKKAEKKDMWSKFTALVDTHPDPLQRAQRFEERAAQLEAKENKK